MAADNGKNGKRLDEAKVLHVGGEAEDCEVSLGIYSDDINIQRLSTLLGHEPTEAHRKGEVIGRRRPASKGLWSLVAPRDVSFPDRLSYLLRATTSDQSVWDELVSDHTLYLRCAVFLHSWTEGFEIPAEVLADIGRRHWQFDLSMYSAEGEEILDAFLTGEKKTNES